MAGNQLEEQLMDAAIRLSDPPSSSDELVSLLHRLGESLFRVEQSSTSAIMPLKNALVCDKLLQHSNKDVKLLLAYCIMELMRITAPNAPYDDEKLKEVLHLIVAAFEVLSELRSCYFQKAISTLELFAKSRVIMVILDLECDELIVKLFQLFFNTIRPDHPNTVFFYMETIMTDAITESDDIFVELLSLLLATVKKDMQSISPTSWMLGKNVIENCGAKLEPYLVKAVRSMGVSLDSYDHIIRSKCQNTTNNVTSWGHGPKEPKEKSTELLSTRTSLRRSIRKRPVFPKLESCQSTKLQQTSSKMLLESTQGIEMSPNIPTIPYENQKSGKTAAIVNGYEVKVSSAPILTSIFSKYGDIASNCHYKTDSMRASLLEILCAIITRLQSTNVPLSTSELKIIRNELQNLETANIEVSWLSELLDKMSEVGKFAQMKTTLKSVKANSMFVIKAANKELEEAVMELVAVQKRIGKAEKCVSAMKVVTGKLEDAIKEAEKEQLVCQQQMDWLL